MQGRPGVRGLARGGAFDARLILCANDPHHLTPPPASFCGFVEAQRPPLSRLEIIYPPIPLLTREKVPSSGLRSRFRGRGVSGLAVSTYGDIDGQQNLQENSSSPAKTPPDPAPKRQKNGAAGAKGAVFGISAGQASSNVREKALPHNRKVRVCSIPFLFLVPFTIFSISRLPKRVRLTLVKGPLRNAAAPRLA